MFLATCHGYPGPDGFKVDLIDHLTISVGQILFNSANVFLPTVHVSFQGLHMASSRLHVDCRFFAFIL